MEFVNWIAFRMSTLNLSILLVSYRLLQYHNSYSSLFQLMIFPVSLQTNRLMKYLDIKHGVADGTIVCPCFRPKWEVREIKPYRRTGTVFTLWPGTLGTSTGILQALQASRKWTPTYLMIRRWQVVRWVAKPPRDILDSVYWLCKGNTSLR